MQLWFFGDIEDLKPGIDFLAHELKYSVISSGIPIMVEKTTGDIEVILENGKGVIRYFKKIHFFRALGLFVEACRERADFRINECPRFERNGVMFDTSRNGVLKVESIKKILAKMAVMGLNVMLLYMEDTYTIDKYPYFGYMRGRYSFNELKECDGFADYFGIEIVPCIQTLAHLSQLLKWNFAKDMADTEDILLVGQEKTYEFIEEMVKAASAPFKTRRIHIGMDEPFYLGLGKYLMINGHRERFSIINEHLKKVLDIIAKYNLQAIIWSDLYFAAGSKNREYWDLNTVIPEDVLRDIPSDIQMVYWDYHHRDGNFIQNYLKKHLEYGFNTVFAGGVVTWFTFCPNYGISFLTSNAALNACKKEGIKEVFVCAWHDDGTECNDFATLLGLQLYAEHGYAGELDNEKLKRRFKFCTGVDFDCFMDLRLLDETPGVRGWSFDDSNPSKFLLWQDILMGLFDKHLEGLELAQHYSNVCCKMSKYRYEYKEWDIIFHVPEMLCNVLAIKADVGLRISKHYRNGDMDSLKRIAETELPELSERILALKKAHKKQWMETYKPFGWEVLDIRYGGLLSRVEYVIERLVDYTKGKIEKIDEVEEEKLKYDIPMCERGEVLGLFPHYRSMVTVSTVF
jgi:N-acetyl-beta-hexosaminidase